MDGAPKDNANPIIHAVDKRDPRSKKRPLGWSQLNSMHVTPPLNKEEFGDSPTTAADLNLLQTPEDRAVIHALMDACEASRGEGVSILRNVGVAIPKYSPDMSHPQRYLPSSPCFVPSTFRSEIQKERLNELDNMRGKRDPIEPDEIFEIIRNIQVFMIYLLS